MFAHHAGDESHQRADEDETQRMDRAIDRGTFGAGKDGHPRTSIGFKEDGVVVERGMVEGAGDDKLDEEEEGGGVETRKVMNESGKWKPVSDEWRVTSDE